MKSLKKISIPLLSLLILVLLSINSYGFYGDYTKAPQGVKWDRWCEEWDKLKNNYKQICLTPGKDETELNFAWYSKENQEVPKLKISKNPDMTDAIDIKVHSTKAIDGYNSNKATASALKKNSRYYYSYSIDGKYTRPVLYKTQGEDKFSFIFVGDPQIGASNKNQSQDKACQNDSFNWNDTLNKAFKIEPNASFIISAGDQIQSSNNNEIEYSAYLSPEILRSVPVANTIGNHDANSENYSFHFNNPNCSDLGKTAAGGNYYYKYNNTLFITLNTNNKNAQEHREFIKKVIYENKYVKWRVVNMHHDIYGAGIHYDSAEIVKFRSSLVPIFEESNIDIVLSGHDHTYSRSKSINDIVYMTGDSSSGSKYYEIANPKPEYIDASWQGNVPTFSVINVDENKFVINTYRTDNLQKIDKTYSISKN